MTYHQQGTFPPTLVFNSVDAFVEAVQSRSIMEIGCVTLQRSTPFEGGMLERRTSFALLTARDTTRDEILSCSVFLKYGDFVGGDQLYMPPEEWRRQLERGEQVRHRLLRHLQAVPNIRVLDAAYHVHPDVCMRFAGFTVDEPSAAESARGPRLVADV
ncbi:MAG TPA: hypothetical protein VLA19_07060 [Herpetosiphonaceae bacterium]|nr:hypothetical protein [Herpetosiphonaceae bacterium]